MFVFQNLSWLWMEKNNQFESFGPGRLNSLQHGFSRDYSINLEELFCILVLICFPIFQVYANGIRNIDLHYIIRKLAAPVISVLLLSLCVPYVIAAGIVPLLGE